MHCKDTYKNEKVSFQSVIVPSCSHILLLKDITLHYSLKPNNVMTKEEALKQFAYLGAVWFGNSKQHFAFSAYDRLQGWNKLADKWKEEAEEEWDEAEEVLNRLVELGCKPAELQELMKTIEFPFYDDPKQQIETDYEPEAVKMLSELAAAFADDYPTQKLIQKWIDGEVEHMAWEAQYLYHIEKLGYENFLIAMM